MTLITQINSLATAIATDVKTIYGRIGTLTNLTTTTKTDLVSAVNEVKAAADAAASSGGATNLDGLTDVTLSATANGQIVRYNSTTSQWENVNPLTYFEAAGAAATAQTNAINASQPRDSDLTAIAALATTAYGQNLLTLANQAALTGLISVATSGAAGIIPLATQTEVNTGTDATKAVTSATLQSKLGGFQPLDSDLTAIAALATTAFGRSLLTLADSTALTGQVVAGTTAVAGKVQLATTAITTTGTDQTQAATSAGVAAAIQASLDNNSALGTSTTKAPTQAAVKTYTDALLDATNAMQFKGGIDASTNPNYPAANAGWTYKITVAGKIGGASGPNVEIGDTIYCTTDGSAAGTQATVGANWVITQNNIDGAVTGPTSSINSNIAIFSGTGGKLIADAGVGISGAVAANGNVVTGQAVVNYAQPVDVDLSAIAALVSAADKMIYATGAGTWALTTINAQGRSLLGAVDAATARGVIGAQDSTSIGDTNTDFVATYTAAKA